MDDGGNLLDRVTGEAIHLDFLARLSPHRLERIPQDIARIVIEGATIWPLPQWSALFSAINLQQIPMLPPIQTDIEHNTLQPPVQSSQQGNLPLENHNTGEQERKTHRSTEKTAETHRQKNTQNRRGSVHHRGASQRKEEQRRHMSLSRPRVNFSQQQVHQRLHQLVQNQRKKDQPKERYEDLFRKGGFGERGGFKEK